MVGEIQKTYNKMKQEADMDQSTQPAPLKSAATNFLSSSASSFGLAQELLKIKISVSWLELLQFPG